MRMARFCTDSSNSECATVNPGCHTHTLGPAALQWCRNGAGPWLAHQLASTVEKVQTRRRLRNHGVDVFRPLKIAGDVDSQQLEYWYSFKTTVAPQSDRSVGGSFAVGPINISLVSRALTFIRISSGARAHRSRLSYNL